MTRLRSAAARQARRAAVKTGEWLLIIALFAGFFIVWAALAQVTGLRAKLYQNMPLSVVVVGGGMALAAGAAWVCRRWIVRKLRARKAGKPPFLP